MRNIYRFSALFLAIIIAAAGVIPAAADSTAYDYAKEIIAYNLNNTSSDSVQEWIDGELKNSVGTGSEWYVIALNSHGKYDFSSCKAALNGYLSENEIGSASSRLKYALTYIAIGDKTNPYIDKALGNSIGEQGLMSLVFGLHLLNNGCRSEKYELQELTEEILSLQLPDGGWSIQGVNGDIDSTAMVVQALAPQYSKNDSVKAATDKAIDFLSARQLESGEFSSYGIPNPESTSQVIIALSSLGKDIMTDGRFIKNGNTVFDGISLFRLHDGSFSHTEGGSFNSTATVQVFCACVSYNNMKNGGNPFYIFSESKSEEATVEHTTEALTELQTSQAVSETAADKTTAAHIAEDTAEKGENKNNLPLIIGVLFTVAALVCIIILAVKKKKQLCIVMITVVAAVLIAAAMFTGLNNRNEDIAGRVTISIRCDTVKDSGESFVPESGIVLNETEVEIKADETVFDALCNACKANGIAVESSGFSAFAYISGIGGIYERDFGDSSGWIYFVNGVSPSVSCGQYKLTDGDVIEWHYTCDFGKDIDSNI